MRVREGAPPLLAAAMAVGGEVHRVARGGGGGGRGGGGGGLAEGAAGGVDGGRRGLENVEEGGELREDDLQCIILYYIILYYIMLYYIKKTNCRVLYYII